jgi:hypothetical protein
VWKAGLGEERHHVFSLFLEGVSKVPFLKRVYCWRLRYTGGLKTRNNYGSESLRILCHRVWVTEDHKGEDVTWS